MTAKTARARRVLLLGYFDRGNLGDDAMRDALMTFAARHYPMTHVRCVSLQAIHGLRLQDGLELLRLLRWADSLVLAGGSHFHDRLGRRSVRVLTAFVLLFLVARSLGVRVAYAGIGVGPVSRRVTRPLVRVLLRLSSTTLVRDEASARTAQELSPAQSILQGADVTALMAIPQAPRRQRFSTLGLSLLPYFGVYEGDSARDVAAVRNLAESVVEAHAVQDLAVRPFCFYTGSAGVPAARTDVPVTAEFARLIAGRVPIREPGHGSVHATLAEFCDVDGLFAVRYHAALLGYLIGLPMVVVTYDQKSRELVREIGLPRQATLEPGDLLDGAVLADTLRELRDSPATFRAELPVHVMRERAQSGLERFASRLCGDLTEG